jgi:hypothetical protein
LHRCHACATGAKKVEQFQKDHGDPAGIHVLIRQRG